MSFRPLALILAILTLTSATLPATGPTPEKRPETEQLDSKTGDASNNGNVAKPTQRPDENEDNQAKPSEGEIGNNAKPEAQKPDVQKETEKPVPPAPIMAENEQDHAACLVDLKAIGATFESVPRIDDGSGCGIDKPLKVTTVLPGITLKPEGTMRCETALELARWTKEAVLPAAKAALESEGELTTINQASSYICRLRNNAKAGKISEHARGNAIDIASFTFKSGKTIAIEPRDEDSTLSGAFQRAVTASGCLYFETVLDPGSDEAHENHLHFDVLQRKGGYRYCR
ncbi:extensin family protein [Pararhizobium arenae]|uniref:extensin-like domain-containing protein n=1 Tax=Pararhizobium arenae TaxID=1856850 RepID=UPI00094B19F8|nr:extensin family protein [Pararhizobium arenae]